MNTLISSNISSKTILITGGAGALGSALVSKYLQEGHRVIALDNLMKTKTTENIDQYMGNPRFRFLKHDINKPIDFPNERIDWIFNMACPVSAIALQVDPIHTIQSSTVGVINMLELARKHGAVFLQASSADIYGEMADQPFRESDWGSVNPLSPRACYEEGKRVAETIATDYHRIYGVQVKIARIFNTAGPNTQITDGRIPTVFIYQALSGRDIVIYGKDQGTGTRCFLHVDDLVEGLDRLMHTPSEYIGPVNLGNTEEITIIDLAKKIIQKTNSTSHIVFDRPDDAPKFRKPDISKAKQDLGWEPTKTLDMLLDDMIAHYRAGGLPESKVLVFATTYHPNHGPAEEALARLAEAMPHVEFHVVTSRFRKNNPRITRIDNVEIYRIGFGFTFDKYLLPFLGAWKAKQLDRKNHYRFMWSVMGSYGGLAGLILKILGSRAAFLIAHDDREMYANPIKRWLVDLVERTADETYRGIEAQELDAFIAKVRSAYANLARKQEGKLERPV